MINLIDNILAIPVCFDKLRENEIEYSQNKHFFDEKIILSEKKNSFSPLSKNTEKTSSQTPNHTSNEKIQHKRNLSSHEIKNENKNQNLLNNNKPNKNKIKDLDERAQKRKENKNIIKQKYFMK